MLFGYLILISIDFYDFISPFSPQFQFRQKRYIKHKHSRQCLTTFSNTSKFVKNTPLRVVFSTLFSVFGNVVKHGLSCLIYYISSQWWHCEIHSQAVNQTMSNPFFLAEQHHIVSWFLFDSIISVNDQSVIFPSLLRRKSLFFT